MRIPLPQLIGIVALAAIWGASFMFIKVMLDELGPVAVAWLRLLGGAPLILGVAFARGARLPRSRRYWLDVAVVGLLGSAIPLVLIPWGEQEISSALAGVLNGAMPLWVALLALWFLPLERLDRARGLGLALGFAGLVLVIGPEVLSVGEASTRGALAVVLATLGYAASAVYVRRRLQGAHSTLLAGVQSVLAVLMLTPLLLIAESAPDPAALSGRVVLATLGLALLSSGVAYIVYYWLLATIEATQAALTTYLIPLFAIFWGWLVLDETVAARVAPGLALIVAGVWLAGRRAARPALASTEAPAVAGDD